jgi:hypothetical protein
MHVHPPPRACPCRFSRQDWNWLVDYWTLPCTNRGLLGRPHADMLVLAFTVIASCALPAMMVAIPALLSVKVPSTIVKRRLCMQHQVIRVHHRDPCCDCRKGLMLCRWFCVAGLLYGQDDRSR